MTPAYKRSISRKLGFTPGGRKDPWRKFWRKEIGIYIETLRGRNRSGTAVGMDIAWSPEEMVPTQSGEFAFEIKRQYDVARFNAALIGYDSSSNGDSLPEEKR